MSLNDVYLASQIAAALAVVLSLSGLMLSIRQNTRAQELAAKIEGYLE